MIVNSYSKLDKNIWLNYALIYCNLWLFLVAYSLEIKLFEDLSGIKAWFIKFDYLILVAWFLVDFCWSVLMLARCLRVWSLKFLNLMERTLQCGKWNICHIGKRCLSIALKGRGFKPAKMTNAHFEKKDEIAKSDIFLVLEGKTFLTLGGSHWWQKNEGVAQGVRTQI